MGSTMEVGLRESGALQIQATVSEDKTFKRFDIRNPDDRLVDFSILVLETERKGIRTGVVYYRNISGLEKKYNLDLLVTAAPLGVLDITAEEARRVIDGENTVESLKPILNKVILHALEDRFNREDKFSRYFVMGMLKARLKI